jgi:hypothetical protein
MSNELTDNHVLRGPEAVQALNCYAQELENYRGGDLTNTQVDILIRTARLLSQAISDFEDPKPQLQSDAGNT